MYLDEGDCVIARSMMPSRVSWNCSESFWPNDGLTSSTKPVRNNKIAFLIFPGLFLNFNFIEVPECPQTIGNYGVSIIESGQNFAKIVPGDPEGYLFLDGFIPL